MVQLSDVEIARRCSMLPIADIAHSADIDKKHIDMYGRYKAKVDLAFLDEKKSDGRLILVTAINPTSAGEGKTTTAIGLADGLRRLGRKSAVAMREPSSEAASSIGGGYAQVVPMEDAGHHFTGDIHAIAAADNLLAAILDNHIQQGNALNIDTGRITWQRCGDAAASEIMAILCLASSVSDLRERLSRIVVGYSLSNLPVTAGDLKAHGAMTELLLESIKPNLVQTLEGTPVFIHGAPFSGIAQGGNSVLATKMALRAGEYCVTEADFGTDTGAEKFLDIKCRAAGLTPGAAVIVASVRALKMHGGLPEAELDREDLEALERGIPNLLHHVSNMTNVYGLPCVVAVNRFPADTDREIEYLKEKCAELGVKVCLSNVWAEGGSGGMELAREVIRLCEEQSCDFTYCYGTDMTIEEKLSAVTAKIYGGSGISLLPAAQEQIKLLTELGFGRLPVCIAKTRYSFSDDPAKYGSPSGFRITVRSVKVSAGAGFIVALTGENLTADSLPA